MKLLDFGLAKLYGAGPEHSRICRPWDSPATRGGSDPRNSGLYVAGTGTGQAGDVRSDIFSFGLVLYEMLSGRRAFSGDRSCNHGGDVEGQTFSAANLPSLEKIVRRCLAKQPAGPISNDDGVQDGVGADLEKERPAAPPNRSHRLPCCPSPT